ncbi:MAG: polymerase sigma factor RpoD, partial [Cyanobacteriota bacterium]
MSPAAATNAKKPAPEILLVANAAGETIKVAKPKASRAKAKPAEADAAEGSEAANKVTPTKAKAAAKTKASASKTTTKAAAKSTTTKAAGTKAKTAAKGKAKGEADVQAGDGVDLDAAADELLAAAAEPADAKASEKDSKAAKALASIKVGPKGVYTEDSIRVYLQEIGRIRLLRPDEEIELARKIADLLQLEELAAQFEADHGHYPDTKEWAALVEMPLVKFRRRLMLGRRAKEKMVQSNLRLVVSIAK